MPTTRSKKKVQDKQSDNKSESKRKEADSKDTQKDKKTSPKKDHNSEIQEDEPVVSVAESEVVVKEADEKRATKKQKTNDNIPNEVEDHKPTGYSPRIQPKSEIVEDIEEDEPSTPPLPPSIQFEQNPMFSPSTAPKSPAKSILRAIPHDTASPKKVTGVKSPKPSRSPTKVSFKQVEVREYARCHGGGAGVPKSGAYPLGLDWTYSPKSLTRTVSDYEKNKNTDTSAKDGVVWLPEKERKKVLEVFDHRASMTRDASFQKEKQELSQLREARKHIGCGCKGDQPCSTNRCQCAKQGIHCNISSCTCEPDVCGNPTPETLDQEVIDELRKKKIQELKKSPVRRRLYNEE